MTAVRNFVDELAKHKLLVYFVTLWGATLFLDTVYGFTAWGLDGFYWVGTSAVVDLFFHFSELFAGVILVILGVKLLKPHFLETVAPVQSRYMGFSFLRRLTALLKSAK